MTDAQILDCKKRMGGRRLPVLIFTDAVFEAAKALAPDKFQSANYEEANTKTRANAARAEDFGIKTFEINVDEEILAHLLLQ